MKIVGITDLHGRFPPIIKEFKDFADVLIVSGDITHFGRNIEIIEKLSELSDHMDVFCIPGNCDTKEVIDELNNYGLNIDGKVKKVENINFVGLGGSNKTPFNTPNEYTEEELYCKLLNLVRNLKNVFLITHVPPYNTMADIIDLNNDIHVGSKSIRKIIEEFNDNIIFCACGHIHESRCIDKIGKTIIVNPSPKSYFIYDTKKNIVVLEDFSGY
ncbi:Metallophosphoesterase [Methanocaldococcus lauensis]|uniref:Metallophosphoesterase n=1 Tax=Methanocaldococcus lauensis TaxID=2546128 RepID=A0A8D6PTX0_9EURY|nr:metallophosphoesterase [Methanocaldococcus lauensis]CAB3289123.1 Metallophosphoesterase [Methanocaldococcus lauensis]CAB3289883.1 Metallophosphoesterase [Methanocaldococcus lauensis]